MWCIYQYGYSDTCCDWVRIGGTISEHKLFRDAMRVAKSLALAYVGYEFHVIKVGGTPMRCLIDGTREHIVNSAGSWVW